MLTLFLSGQFVLLFGLMLTLYNADHCRYEYAEANKDSSESDAF